MFAPRNSSPPMKCYLTNNDYVAAYQVNLKFSITLLEQLSYLSRRADNNLSQYIHYKCYVTNKCRRILRIFFDHTTPSSSLNRVCDTNKRDDNNKSKNEESDK